MSAIFINYRRDDAGGYALSIHQQLMPRFNAPGVFIDVVGIDAGTDFEKAVMAEAASCSVQLVVIGPTWATVADKDRPPRIEDPDDLVRREIKCALDRGVTVIPVLVQGAKMPAERDLPDDIKALAKRNAISLSHEQWNFQIKVLVEAIDNALPVEPSDPKNGGHTRSLGVRVMLVTFHAALCLVFASLGMWTVVFQMSPTPGVLAAYGVGWAGCAILPLRSALPWRNWGWVAFAILTWTISWSLLLPDPIPDAIALLLMRPEATDFGTYVRLFTLGACGAVGTTFELKSAFPGNRVAQKELVFVPVIWVFALCVFYYVGRESISWLEVAAPNPATRLIALGLALWVGSILTWSLVRMWRRGHGVTRRRRTRGVAKNAAAFAESA